MIQASAKFNSAPPMAKPAADVFAEKATAHRAAQARKPEQPEGVLHVPRQLPPDLRFLSWTERQISTPRLIRRFMLWGFRRIAYWYTQARMLTLVLRSPEIAEDAYAKRQEICRACQENDNGYCRACNCPKWIYAQLERKNRRSGWLCPRAKHPGEYPKYGCTGCGKSHAAASQSAMAKGV